MCWCTSNCLWDIRLLQTNGGPSLLFSMSEKLYGLQGLLLHPDSFTERLGSGLPVITVPLSFQPTPRSMIHSNNNISFHSFSTRTWRRRGGREKCRRSLSISFSFARLESSPLFGFLLAEPFTLRSKSIATKRLGNFFCAVAASTEGVDKVIIKAVP